MSRTEAAIRRAGAAVAVTAASALMRIPAPEEHRHAVLALHAALLLGCAAVQLAALARRAAEEAARRGMALGKSAAGLRRDGFAGVLLYAVYVVGGDDVRAEVSATEASVDEVNDFLLFLVFLAAVWAVYLSMVTGRSAPTPLPSAAAASEEEDDLDGGKVGSMATRPARVLVDSKL